MGTYKEVLAKIKESQKQMGFYIRSLKNKRPLGQRRLSGEHIDDICYAIETNKHIFRHNHIAYCLFRGVPYRIIEPNIKKGNKPNIELIVEILAEFGGRISPEVGDSKFDLALMVEDMGKWCE